MPYFNKFVFIDFNNYLEHLILFYTCSSFAILQAIYGNLIYAKLLVQNPFVLSPSHLGVFESAQVTTVVLFPM